MPPLRRFLPRGLFGRSLLIVMVPLVLLQAVSAYVFYTRHWEDVGRRLALGLAGEIALLIDAIGADGGQVNAAWLIHRARYDMAVDAQFEPGATLPGRPPHPLFGPVDQTLARVLPERISHPYHFDTRSDPENVRIAVELSTGVLTVTASRKRLFSSTIYVFIGWMVGTSLVLLALAIYFLRRQIRPMRALAHAADSFGKGVLVADFKPYGATEVRQASRAFLRMRERIRRQLTQRTEMLAGVSHDLRTPLTRMKLQLEMGADAEAVAALKADVADMERMIEGYLAFARGEGSESASEVAIADLLEEVAADALRNGVALGLGAVPEAIQLTLRRNAVKRALTNLVDNAARYGSRVELAAGATREALSITIDDDGPGIPADSREAVLKPFFRLDASRNPGTGSVGLGLSIAADVVRNHGGDLALEDSPLGGLRARVTLPL
ncbi:MAG: ATP-binding protein [Alphaproteobacteria bacterium]|jgi:two-component system osmolarity sensor histidine kinase EnvZ|nr:ATP-binding protein [Alphaproteobacteria bacterium]